MRKKVRQLNVWRPLEILVAVAVLFGPVLTHVGAAIAAVPDHEMQMMQASSCEDASAHKASKNGVMSCCIATYLAVEISARAPRAQLPVRTVPPLFELATLHRSHPCDLPTPPPRLS